MEGRTSRKKGRMSWPGLLGCLLVAGFLAVAGLCGAQTSEAGQQVTRYVPENFTELASKNSPAVVNIRAEKVGSSSPFSQFRGGPFDREHPWHDFFEKFFGGPPRREHRQRSLGSGFIIDEGGLIVTNNHVVEDADRIRVILKDGLEFDAEVKGRDPNTDLALIEIKANNNLPKIELGDSDSLQIGEWVVAIGNPFGLGHTVTAGIISAKGRVIGSGPYDDFLQTDASINPGNSGGPLIDMNGKVVGINTAIVAGGQGIGFAIPVNMARGIIEQLKTTGEVRRGWLGVGIQDLSQDLKEYYGVKEEGGVLVTQVFAGDPADKAGIQVKDVILEVNGQKVANARELTRLIAEAGVGKEVEIVALRKGKKKTFSIALGKRDDTRIASAPSARDEQQDAFGISVAELTPEMAQEFNLKDVEGVVVTDVAADSKGEKAGVQIGDLIREVNHETIGSVEDYLKEIKKVKEGDSISLIILRANTGYLLIRLTK